MVSSNKKLISGKRTKKAKRKVPMESSNRTIMDRTQRGSTNRRRGNLDSVTVETT
jgi:hypothetical protein